MPETLLPILIPIGIGLASIFVLVLIISRLYKRASKERAFVRTGFGGQKIVMNGGAVILPVIQETIEVNMNTMRLNISRNNEAGLITKDRMRVDVQAEFFVRVKPTEDAIADAAQTLGRRTMEPTQLKELVEGKFVDALRSVAAEMTMEELHEKRVEFVQRVQTTVSEDILKNGLELESVSLTALDQTSQDFLNPQNAFDAQGLAKITEIIEGKRKERNAIEQETKVAIQLKNLEAEKLSLQLARDAEYARLEQEREVTNRKALQSAEIAREQAARTREAREAEIESSRQIEIADQLAKQEIEKQRIELARQIAQQEILKKQAVEAAEIEKAKLVELTEQDRAIAIAEKSKAKSEAEAAANVALADSVRTEERVVTAKEIEAAERRKAIELVLAAEEAEREALKKTVAATAEKKAALDTAEAVKTAAHAAAEAERIAAEARAAAYSVDAKGKRDLNEAENLLSQQLIEARIRQLLIEHLPEIIRESVKPMEHIDGIKIIQVEGLGGGAGSAPGEPAANSGSLADQLVNSALRYRGQAPLLDSLMHEIGLKGGDINGLIPDAKVTPEALPKKAEAPAHEPDPVVSKKNGKE